MRKRTKKVGIVLTILCSIVMVFVLTFLFIKFSDKGALGALEIESLDFVVNGEVVTNVETEVYGENISLGVKINNLNDISRYDKPEILWRVVGDNSVISVNNDGVVKIGNTIGSAKIEAYVKGKNTFSKLLPISVQKKSGSELSSISVFLDDGYEKTYVEGQKFDKNSIRVFGNYGDYFAKQQNFEVEDIVLTSTTYEVSVSCSGKSTTFPISVKRKTLQSVEVAHRPNKTAYVEGQYFDKTGMTLKANYEYFSEIVSDFTMSQYEPLSYGTRQVTVSFTYNGVTKETFQIINVSKRVLEEIVLDTTNVKKDYVQGDVFDIGGLIVTAKYRNFEDRVVSNFIYPKTPLKSSDQSVAISYSENGTTVTAFIENIVVERPYANKMVVKLEAPEYLTISWLYKYLDDIGVEKTDYDAYEENNLLCNPESGTYQVPVGAVVTVRGANATVSNLIVDGNACSPEQTSMTFTAEKGQTRNFDVAIIGGEKKIIKFSGDGKDQSFIYSKNWSGTLTATDLKKLSQMFADSTSYYYSYKIGGNTYNYAELSSVVFDKSTLVEVLRNEIVENEKVLSIKYYDEFSVDLSENIENYTVDTLPKVKRAGYTLVGFSLSENGEALTNQTLSEYLAGDQTAFTIYALWQKNLVDYSSSAYVGVWSASGAIDEDQIGIVVTFNDDGTFTYVVTKNSEENVSYYGIFSLSGDVLTIESVETNADATLIAPSEFEFSLSGEKLACSIFIVEQYSVLKFSEELDKK